MLYLNSYFFSSYVYDKDKEFKVVLESYAEVRRLTSNKICFKNGLSFLKFKPNLTNSLSNKIVSYGQFYTIYRQVRMYYVSLLRANFMAFTPNYLSNYVLEKNFYKNFLLFYERKLNYKEFDCSLFYRGKTFLSLFDVVVSKSKYGNNKFITRLVFLKINKRYLFAFKWLSIMLKSFFICNKLNKNLIPVFNNYLSVSKDKSFINKTKLKIYKLKLLQL
jgi:hypothetical protein